MKVEKCDKIKGELPLAPTDPWRGLGTENPATRAHLLIKTPPKLLCFKKKSNQPHVIIGGLGNLWGMNACSNTIHMLSLASWGRVQEHVGE
jgi:hypothetical protein